LTREAAAKSWVELNPRDDDVWDFNRDFAWLRCGERTRPSLMATLLYGAGLRLIECCRLRIKVIDFTTK
jgi:integrase